MASLDRPYDGHHSGVVRLGPYAPLKDLASGGAMYWQIISAFFPQRPKFLPLLRGELGYQTHGFLGVCCLEYRVQPLFLPQRCFVFARFISALFHDFLGFRNASLSENAHHSDDLL